MERDRYLAWLKRRLMDLDHEIVCATQQRGALLLALSQYEIHLDKIKKQASAVQGVDLSVAPGGADDKALPLTAEEAQKRFGLGRAL